MMTIISAAARKVSSTTSAVLAETAIRRMTVIGMGLTRMGAGLVCFHARSIRWNREFDLEGQIEPRVFGPHIKERLGNVPYVIFSRSRLEGIPVGSKFSRMYSFGKDL